MKPQDGQLDVAYVEIDRKLDLVADQLYILVAVDVINWLAVVKEPTWG